MKISYTKNLYRSNTLFSKSFFKNIKKLVKANHLKNEFLILISFVLIFIISLLFSIEFKLNVTINPNPTENIITEITQNASECISIEDIEIINDKTIIIKILMIFIL